MKIKNLLSLIANKYPKIKEPMLPDFEKCRFLLSNGPDKKERTKTQWTRRNAESC